MSTPKERAEQQRRDKLELVREQVATGQLTIRKMTAAERAAHPPQQRPPKPRRY